MEGVAKEAAARVADRVAVRAAAVLAAPVVVRVATASAEAAAAELEGAVASEASAAAVPLAVGRRTTGQCTGCARREAWSARRKAAGSGRGSRSARPP